MINLEKFINENVTKRQTSMFVNDIIKNKEILKQKIYKKTIRVNGGAGSIGSSFIRAIRNF